MREAVEEGPPPTSATRLFSWPLGLWLFWSKEGGIAS